MTRQVVDGSGYEVRTAGPGTGDRPPVLFLHGFTGRGADWRPFLRAVHEAGHATINLDLLGHGRSDAPSDPAAYAIERQAAAVASILRKLGAAPAIVVGYSMGARIALRITATEPSVVSGLVLESPSAGIADPDERASRLAADRALADRLEHDGLEAFLRAWEANPLFAGEHRLSQRRRDAIHRARATARVAGLAGSLRGAGQGAMEPLHDRLRAIRAPTLVIAGGLDPAGAARALAIADSIPTADLLTLTERGHAPHREAPATFRRILIDQLNAWRPDAA
jgi:2-succinyl-6-hydroxy-2,4-cyclohexadiene-1-carboxylate synthase